MNNKYEELFIIKKSKSKKSKIAKWISFSLLGGIGIILTPALASIVAAALTEYYPDSILELKIDKKLSNRNYKKLEIGKENQYTALTYNAGFCSLGQGSYSFLDTGKLSSYFVSNSVRAKNKHAVENITDAICRLISPEHDVYVESSSGLLQPNLIWPNKWSLDANNYVLESFDDSGKAVINPSNKDVLSENLRGSVVYKTTYNEGKIKNTQLTCEEVKTEFNNSSFDIVGAQEIDANSSRSQHVNIYDELYKKTQYYDCSYGVNFSLPWMPLPLFSQNMGEIESGVMSLSQFQINSATRYSLKSIETPIYKYLTLKRCILENRIPINGTDKELTFIVTHLDAYDNGGTVRAAQLQTLDKIISEEYKKGNYVIACADWNCTLPDTPGYEGNDALSLEDRKEWESKYGSFNYNDDASIPSWDYKRINKKVFSPDNPNNNQFYKENNYDPNVDYKTNDVVIYKSVDQELNGFLPNMQKYKNGLTTNLYEAVVDHPKNPPLINGDKELNYNEWRNYTTDDEIYRNCDLNHKMLVDEMPNLFSIDQNGKFVQKAHFYTTNAIPSLRTSSAIFRPTDNYNSYSNIFKRTVDGFLCTDNIAIEASYGFDNQFIYSDHQAVAIKFWLESPTSSY